MTFPLTPKPVLAILLGKIGNFHNKITSQKREFLSLHFHGKVVLPSGLGVSGATALLLGSNDQPTGQAVSGSDGTYALTILKMDAYTLTLSHPDGTISDVRRAVSLEGHNVEESFKAYEYSHSACCLMRQTWIPEQLYQFHGCSAILQISKPSIWYCMVAEPGRHWQPLCRFWTG